MLILKLSNTAAAGTITDTLLDIALAPTGGGSEQIIVPDFLCGWLPLGNSTGQSEVHLPIFLPKGLALRGRVQGNVVSETVDVAVMLFGGMGGAAWPTYSGCDAYGIDTDADSSGTSHTAADSGSESTWVDFGTTMSRNYKGLMLRAHGTNTTQTNVAYHFEVGVASTTYAEWHVLNDTGEATEVWPQIPIPCNIPAGTQLMVRGECSGVAQAMELALYLFY
jgi:hypothetical protein